MQQTWASTLSGRKAVMIFGYDYDGWPMDPVIEAFEILARTGSVLATDTRLTSMASSIRSTLVDVCSLGS